MLGLKAICVVLAVGHATAATKVLQMGDSWTHYSAQHLATYCAGATTVNRGVVSSKATEWSSGATSCPAEEATGSCSMTDAFSSTHGSGYTHAVLSIGGNDFLDTGGCSMTATDLQSRVTAAINALRSAAQAAGISSISIIIPAYCAPTQAVGDCNVGHFKTLNDGLKAAADAAADVTFIDAIGACGGSATSYSTGAYHFDSIHLNAKGYCEVYTMPAFQAALGCNSGVTYDCSQKGQNFPVKSINLASAPTVSFYEGPSVASYGLFDVHPVHGAVLADGSYVMAGKAVEADGSTKKRMFCIKLSSVGAVQWVWGHTIDNQQDAANAVLQLPGGGDIIVVGYQTVSSKFQRSITKLALSDGTLGWTATWPSVDTSKNGAWEMISLTSDNQHVLLAGNSEGSDQSEFNFKSYGEIRR